MTCGTPDPFALRVIEEKIKLGIATEEDLAVLEKARDES